MSKIKIHLKCWVPAQSKFGWSRIAVLNKTYFFSFEKIIVLTHIDQMKPPPPWYTSLENSWAVKPSEAAPPSLPPSHLPPVNRILPLSRPKPLSQFAQANCQPFSFHWFQCFASQFAEANLSVRPSFQCFASQSAQVSQLANLKLPKMLKLKLKRGTLIEAYPSNVKEATKDKGT